MTHLNLRKKVLYAFFGMALIPLVLLAAYSANNLGKVERFLSRNAKNALDTLAARSLEMRADMVAREVAAFLRTAEADVHDLAALEPDTDTYRDFHIRHRRPAWYLELRDNRTVEVRENLPLYTEISWIAPNGQEMIRLKDGAPAPLRNVSVPANTTYGNETYFADAIRLPDGEVYVGRVTGWHIQRQGSEASSIHDHRYRGVVRFARAVRDADGSLEGVVVLSLDHRHLMEFTQHITPTEERFVVSPSYESANYAFMFDDEGWIITHPKYWDIRGLEPDGTLRIPESQDHAHREVLAGTMAYNLLYAELFHKNYPVVARNVLAGTTGVVDVTNVGGSEKIMAYAPIRYDSGVYAKSGVFGGITIGAEVSHFHTPAENFSSVIKTEVTRFIHRSWLLILITMVIVLGVSYRLSVGVTRPLLRLIDATREMMRGNLPRTIITGTNDEVGTLAESFNKMAVELDHRRARLEASLEEILRERNFKTTVFEHIEMGIITLDSDNVITSMNGPAREILCLDAENAEGHHLLDIPCRLPELCRVLKEALEADVDNRWSSYVNVMSGGMERIFRAAFLPLAETGSGGRILTIEDLTERVNMRKQMQRMESLAAMGRLSAGLAHEIRNPLTGISIMLDDLHDRLTANPNDRTLIQRSLEEIERLENLVNELLNFAASPRSNLAMANIGDVLADVVFFVAKQCERSGITLAENVSSDLPSFPIDAGKIKQAFLNLFTNSIEAMPEGGTINIEAWATHDDVTVTIADTGCGIPPERVPNIFEPFYTSKGEGTGLGLAITHNVVSEHGGRIEVASDESGTTFSLIFPVKAAV